jgi:hypothetical protein
MYPMRTRTGDSDADEVLAFNKQTKEKRRLKKTVFCAEGEPGAVFQKELEKLRDSLLIPVGKQRDAAIHAAPSLDGGLKEMFAAGMHFMVPAFFELLLELAVRRQQDFRIVFRTFGIDIHEITQELNLFCEGLHPLSPEGVRLDGSDPAFPDLRILSSQQHGAFFRNGEGSAGLHCAFGTLDQAPTDLNGLSFQEYWTKQPKEKKHKNNSGGNTADVEDESNGEAILPVSTFEGVRTTLNDRLRDHNVLAMRDYYPYWSRQGEADDAGKILLVDTAEKDWAQIFFDDNVERDYAHIVDCRDIRGEGAPITFEHSSGKYLARSEPFLAITELNYFINLVDSCVRKQHVGSLSDTEECAREQQREDELATAARARARLILAIAVAVGFAAANIFQRWRRR